MPGADLETTPISRLSANYYLTYANLPVTGVRTGELGYATDRQVLYRWSSTAWQALTIYSGSGTLANRPNAATLPNGSIYYETDTGITDQIVAGAWIAISGSPGEGHITISPFSYDSIIQGTWAGGIDTLRMFYYYFENTSRLNADKINYKVYLAAGTYTLQLMANKSTNRAIVTVSIDGVDVHTEDYYNDPALATAAFRQTGIVIATAGLKDLAFRANGKNAASSDYTVTLQGISLWRTS